jgi:beta-N-acetylhexosaminidase
MRARIDGQRTRHPEASGECSAAQRNGYGEPPFNRPIFTDHLSTMKAITDRYDSPDAVLKALQAGADTALWLTNTEIPSVLDRLVAALAHNELSMPRIDTSVRRMAEAKALNRCRH